MLEERGRKCDAGGEINNIVGLRHMDLSLIERDRRGPQGRGVSVSLTG